MQLELSFMAETPYPGLFNSLRAFAEYVKQRAAASWRHEHTEWLDQWRLLCIYEAIPGILILERMDSREWSALAVAQYARAFFPKGQIYRIAPTTAGGVKRRKNVVMLTNDFERVKSCHVNLEDEDAKTDLGSGAAAESEARANK